MLLRSLSFTSSGGEEGELTASCLSPGQQPPSIFHSSSMSETSSPFQRQQNSMAAAANAAAAAASTADAADAAAAATSRSALSSPFSCAGAAGSSGASNESMANSALPAAGRQDNGRMQVVRTASGSFTRVRLAASAPAAGAAGSSNNLAGAGSGGGSSNCSWLAPDAAQQGSSGQQLSCVQLQHYTGGPLDGVPIRRVSSSGGVSVMVRHAASAGAELVPPRSSSSNGRSVNGWTSSRAWGSGSRQSSAIQFGKVALPSACAPAACSSGSGGGGSVSLRSAFSSSGSSSGSAGNSAARVSFSDDVVERPQQPGEYRVSSVANAAAVASAAAAAAAAAEAACTASLVQGMMTLQQAPAVPKRQKSVPSPLPTLQESPAPTPGSSPQLPATGSNGSSSYMACWNLSGGQTGGSMTQAQMQEQAQSLQQQLGLVAEQQRQHKTRPQAVARQVPADASDSSNSPSHLSATELVSSLEDDHSLAGYLASDMPDGPEGPEGPDLCQPDSPPYARRTGRSFEFSRPPAIFDAYTDSPAQLGNCSLRQR